MLICMLALRGTAATVSGTLTNGSTSAAISGQTVYLADSNWTGFSFSNLPYGTYKLFGDAWGKTNPVLTVTLSAAMPSINNVKFEENSTTFKGTLNSLSVPIHTSNTIGLYPNPARDVLQLVGVPGAVSVSLHNVFGVLIRQVAVNNGSALSIPVADLHAGMYYAEIQSPGTSVSRQVIIKQ